MASHVFRVQPRMSGFIQPRKGVFMQYLCLPTVRRLARLSCAGLLLAAACAPALAGPVLDRIKASGKIVLAHRESSVPFSYLDADKKPVGYAVELCLKLADAVRKKLELKALAPEFLQVTPANRIAMVEQGKADMECGSTTNNAERREKVAFTVPHYITGARYVVRADSPITELRGFEGRKLVSTKGTTPLKAIHRANTEGLLGINILEAPDHARGIEMVEKGEADGFAMDDVLLYGLIAGRPDPGKLKVVGKFLTIEPLAIMVPKNDPEFKKILDEEMKRLIYSKEAYAIYERWFNKPIPPKNLPLNLPMNYLLKDFWKYPTDQVPG
jgi:ABC-type amino acid transport substrate-binding protein